MYHLNINKSALPFDILKPVFYKIIKSYIIINKKVFLRLNIHTYLAKYTYLFNQLYTDYFPVLIGKNIVSVL